MDNPWIGAVSALGGVLVGGIAEAIRSRGAFRRDKAWTTLQTRRQHLEDVYETLELLAESYGQGVGGVMFAISQGKASDRHVDTKAPWARLRMLVHLYTPSLVSHLIVIEEKGPELGAAMGKGIMAQSGDHRRDAALIDEVLLAAKPFSAAVASMREAIVASSRELDASAIKAIGQ
jgi:hypothetical protein